MRRHSIRNAEVNKGKFVINPQFDAAWEFSEGLAYIVINDKRGFIDTKGNIVINPQFDYVGPFSEGLAYIVINDKWGFIDTKGNIVINPQFDYTWKFSEGLADVKIDGKEGFIDTKGKGIIYLTCGYYGTFHHVSVKHLHRYVAEFAGRQTFREQGNRIINGHATKV